MALDKADLDKITEMINGSLTGDAFTRTIGEAVSAGLKPALAKIDETIATKVTEATKDLKKPDGDGRGADGKFKPDAKDDANARLQAVEKQLVDANKAREESENARRRDQLHAAAKDALAKAGVPTERIRHAMAVLQQDGVLDFAADGSPGFKGKDKYGQPAVLPLEEGATAWIKTDDGKAFLPPTNVQGTGDGAGSRPIVRGADGKVDVASLRGRIGAAVMGANVSE